MPPETVTHHDLIDAPISDWEYGIVETPGGGIIESWLVRP